MASSQRHIRSSGHGNPTRTEKEEDEEPIYTIQFFQHRPNSVFLKNKKPLTHLVSDFKIDMPRWKITCPDFWENVI